MTDINNLITDNIDVWTSAIKKRNATGRGSNKKFELTGIKKLRELILDLAVRGKLVPQDAKDEPASFLLKRVEEERAALVASNKIKKQKPLPQLNIDDVNFDLPLGWAIAYIPEVVSYDKYAIKRGPFGSALKKAYFVAEGIKIYEQQHAIRDDFSLGEYYITEDKFKELSAFEVKPNDLIISCSGTVGKVAIAPEWMKKGIINQALLKISLNESTLTNAYFKILFPAFYMQTETLSDLQGTAQKNMVSVDTLKKEPFPLPSLAEQHRIVAKVDELMALCDQLEQQTEQSQTAHQTLVGVLLNALFLSTTEANAEGKTELNVKEQAQTSVEEQFQESWQRIADHFDVLFTTEASIDRLKQTILQLAVMGKLVPQNPSDEPASKLLEKIAEEKAQLIADKNVTNKKQKQKPLPAITDEENPFELQLGWEWCRGESIADFIDPQPSHRTPPKVDGGVPYIGYTDIDHAKGINFDGARKVGENVFKEHLERYTLKKGDFVFGKIGTLGKPYFLEEPFKYCLSANLILIQPNLNAVVPKYLALYLNSPALYKVMGEQKTNSTHGVFGIKKARLLLIPYPPLPEQHLIVAKVDELMALCDQLKTRLADAQITQLHLADTVVENALN
jgi:type I restriction enzyme S subunit